MTDCGCGGDLPYPGLRASIFTGFFDCVKEGLQTPFNTVTYHTKKSLVFYCIFFGMSLLAEHRLSLCLCQAVLGGEAVDGLEGEHGVLLVGTLYEEVSQDCLCLLLGPRE